jgi:hypothetical protein
MYTVDVRTLAEKGTAIGEGVFIGSRVYVDEGLERLLTIEDGVVISAGVSIILHDSAMNNLTGLPIRYGKVTLRKNCYLGYGTLIMPGVEIGANSLIGARSIVNKDVPADTVAYGSPARSICPVGVYQARYEKAMSDDRFIYRDAAPWRERACSSTPDEELLQFESFVSENRDYIFPDAPSSISPGDPGSRRFLAQGWHEAEKWPIAVRWTKKQATACLASPRHACEIVISYYNIGCRTVTVLLDRKPLGTYDLTVRQWDAIVVPVEDPGQAHTLELTLATDREWVPDELLKNGDIRKLGIAVSEIKIR